MTLEQTAEILILWGALVIADFTMLLVAVRLADMSVISLPRRRNLGRWVRAAPLIIAASVILLLIGAVLKWWVPV
jgi:hypothetical protein